MIYLNRLIYLIVLSVVLSANADHLIFNRVCVNPNEAELIEIYNPTDGVIDLSNYYLSDQNDYYNWVFGNSSNLSSRDFLIKFPNGSQIQAQESFLITTISNDDFFNYYDEMPDISLIDTEFEISEIGSSAGLDNSQEMLVLFYWDGVSSTIQDVDYFLWGSTLRGFSKTTDEGYAYNDTSIENQIFIRNYGASAYADSVYVRNSIDEINENQNQGNGITGHDETSEDLSSSWDIQAYQNSIDFQDIIAGDYDCAGSSQDGCPLGNIDCPIVNPMGTIVDYFDVTVFGGPHAITIEDENGYRIELTIWPDNWDLANDPDYSMILSAPFNRFLVQGYGNVFEYDGEKQILICDPDDFQIIESYDMDGIFEDGFCSDSIYDNQSLCESNGGEWLSDFSSASIMPDPYVLIASENERLDYSYSFPSNSRVIIRVFDISGRFITTLADKHYPSSGIVRREEDKSSWNGKNHMGQVLPPGTYLMHMEASNFQTGQTTIDVAPVVIGVKNK